MSVDDVLGPWQAEPAGWQPQLEEPVAQPVNDPVAIGREEAVVSRSEFRPWARVDTKNIEPIGADDDAQDRKREEASRKTCRGC